MELDILKESLKKRFHLHLHRHKDVDFELFFNALSEKEIEVIKRMELTKGEPDLVVIDGQWYVIDMVKETPSERGNTCYDFKARLGRKKFPPKSSALESVQEIGTTLLDIDLYQRVQDIEDIDLKTSSWLLTPDHMRHLGGAYFGDKRYTQTFLYHNGADSYYSVRGFRSYIEIHRPKR